MLNIVLFGPPGAGKGTQSAKLIDKYGLVHLSTGDIFRANIKGETELGKLAKTYIDAGQLVPDEVTIGMLQSEADKSPSAKGFIFDGFPRNSTQAHALDAFLASRNTSVTFMLALEVEEEELRKRLMLRGQDSGRTDDQDPAIIQKRIDVYHAETSPVKDHYSAQGKYKGVNGIGSIESIFDALCAIIDTHTSAPAKASAPASVSKTNTPKKPAKQAAKKSSAKKVVSSSAPAKPVAKKKAAKKTSAKAKPAVKKAAKKLAKKTTSVKKAVAKKLVKKAAPAPKKVAKKITKKVVAKKAAKKAVKPVKKIVKAVKKKITKPVAKKKAVAKKVTKKVVGKKKVNVKKVVKKAAPANKKVAKKITKKVVVKKAAGKAKKVVKPIAVKATKKATKKASAKKVTQVSRKTAPKSIRKAIKKVAPQKATKQVAKKGKRK